MLACLAAALVAGVARAASDADLRKYLAERPHTASYTENINPIIELLTTTGRSHGIAAARHSLAAMWHVSEGAADAAIDLALLRELASGQPPATRRIRRQAAMEVLERVAPDSREAWRVLRSEVSEAEKCKDSPLRARYFARPWASDDLLHHLSIDCLEWLHDVPAHGAATPLFYGVLTGAEEDGPERALAFRGFRDAVRPIYAVADPVRLYAERGYLSQLADLGLWKEFLDECGALQSEELGRVLDGSAAQDAVTMDSVEIASAGASESLAQDLQPAWVVALLWAGRRDEALAWIDRWHWAGAPVAGRDDKELARGTNLQRATVRRLAADAVDDDPYDLLVPDDSTSATPIQIGSLGSPPGASMAGDFLRRHGYGAEADRLQGELCSTVDPPAEQRWQSFPAELRNQREWIAGRIDATYGAIRRCEKGDGVEWPGGHRGPGLERDMPAALRWPRGLPRTVKLPASARAAFARQSVVRYSSSGKEVAAITLSQAVDPVGEVSGGGYWISLSHDGGHEWGAPCYLGMKEYEPYEIVADSRLPLLQGGRLTIEVAVRELDPASITFPPVGLRTRRSADDRYVELALEDVLRDTDGDGLTDLLEKRLHTDPSKADSDDDGLADGEDPMPQVPLHPEPTGDAGLLRMALHSIFGYQDAAIGTSPPAAGGAGERALEQVIATAHRLPQGEWSERTLFVEGDPADFRGLQPAGRIVVLTAREVAAIRSESGLFFPVTFHVIVDRSGQRGFVQWSAGWTGGSLRFEKKDGQWQPPKESSWIS